MQSHILLVGDLCLKHLRIRASIVVLHDDRILVFRAIDPTSKQEYWFLPGGKIEADEEPWTCAERETLEETGYVVRALRDLEIIKFYNHSWNGKEYDCKTFFYRGNLAEEWHEPRAVVDAEYNKGTSWIPLAEAIEFFQYSPEIFAAVSQLIS